MFSDIFFDMFSDMFYDMFSDMFSLYFASQPPTAHGVSSSESATLSLSSSIWSPTSRTLSTFTPTWLCHRYYSHTRTHTSTHTNTHINPMARPCRRYCLGLCFCYMFYYIRLIYVILCYVLFCSVLAISFVFSSVFCGDVLYSFLYRKCDIVIYRSLLLICLAVFTFLTLLSKCTFEYTLKYTL